MAVSLERFIRQVVESSLLSSDDINAFAASLPPEHSEDVEQLARLLVKQKKLTAFQAQQLYAGKGKSLVLGNYVILDKLGQGGMGLVLKAEHRRMKRLVALKVLSPHVTKNPEMTRRFEREVEAAARLDHPNIVTAHDADDAKGTHFLVMQYVEGIDLSQLVKQQGPLPVERALACLLQAARGLEYAHQRGVVHRDIKPANLLLDRQGTLKILDMGLARLHSAETQADQLTSTGEVMGTVDFMAPEQAMDTKTADARADIYSLGVTLWYLLTGRPMYERETVIKRLMAHQHAPIPSLCEACLEVSPELEAAFFKMVAKTPEARYQSMTEVIADLERCTGSAASAPSVPVGSGEDSRLEDFLRKIDSNDGSTAVATKTRAKKRVAYSPSLEPTVTMDSPLDETDPQTERNPPTPLPVQRTANGRPVAPPWWQNQRTAIAVAGGALVLLLGVVVFFFPTKDGTIRVEINDPEIEVAIKGTQVVLKQADQGQDVKLSPGEKTLIVQRGDFQFETDTLVLKKGETVTVRVERIEGQVEVRQGEKLIGQSQLPSPMVAAKNTEAWHGWPAGAPPPAIVPFTAEEARKHQEAWAAYLKVPVEYTNRIGMKFALIPPGEFMMGSTPAEIEAAIETLGDRRQDWTELYQSEGPQHRVILTQPIYMGIHEVTQAQYEKIMGSNPSHFAPRGAGKDAVAGKNTSNRPVEMVSWFDATDFCTKLSGQEKLAPFYARAGETVTMRRGNGYRLPTEAEWEFACRAGTTTLYWSGKQSEYATQADWTQENTEGRTHHAGGMPPNPFGLHDLHGNLFEWVQDWYDAKYYAQFQEKPAIDPIGPAADSRRAFRDVGVSHAVPESRATHRGVASPSAKLDYLGFRVALTVDAVRQKEPSGNFALSFDGTAGYVMTPVKYDGTHPLTLEAIVTLDPAAQLMSGIITNLKQPRGVAGASLYYQSGGVWAFSRSFRGIEPRVNSVPKVAGGIKTHLAGVWDGKQLSLFVDGRSQSVPGLTHHMDFTEENLSFVLGGERVGDGVEYPFHGLIDEVRISNIARYEGDYSPITRLEADQHTLALYHFDEGQGTMVKDSSGNNHHGKLFGAAKWVPVEYGNVTNDPDRRAAQWWLSIGGTVRVNDEERDIKTADKLPSGGFRLTEVGGTPDKQAVTDAGLAAFQGCENLKSLDLAGSQITDEGLAHFAGSRNLVKLNLYATNVTGSGLVHFGDCQNLEELLLHGTPLTDAGLAHFRDCEKLKSVHLAHTKITDAALALFENTPQLTSLNVDGTQITDAGLIHLKDCESLYSLTLTRSQITDAGLAHLQNCKELMILLLQDTPVTDAGLAHLAGCTKMTILDLKGTQITDAGLAHLQDWKNLTSLGLANTQITDAGLAHLRNLKNLRIFQLIQTQVSDTGLAHLADLTTLNELYLQQTRVTAQGAATLQKQLPNCRIEWDGTPKAD